MNFSWKGQKCRLSQKNHRKLRKEYWNDAR